MRERSDEEVTRIIEPFIHCFGCTDGGINLVNIKELIRSSQSPAIVNLLYDLEQLGKVLTAFR